MTKMTKMTRRFFATSPTIQPLTRLLCASAVALCSLPSLAVERGTFAGDRAYVSGGIGQGEIAGLEAERAKYSLKLMTAVHRSGDYLADANVRISDASKKVVFDRNLQGPWLLIDLAPGRYEVRTSHAGRTQTQTTTIDKGQHRELNVYFDAANAKP